MQVGRSRDTREKERRGIKELNREMRMTVDDIGKGRGREKHRDRNRARTRKGKYDGDRIR